MRTMIYHVMLSACGFDLDIGGECRAGGLVKNEYMWAHSDEEAIELARARITNSLSGQPMVSKVDPSELVFEVEELHSGWDLRWLLRREGFAFHPYEEAGQSDRTAT